MRRVSPHGLSSRRASGSSVGGHVLVGDRPLEPLDREGADRGGAASDVAGNGPPCTIACPTSTPVGQPLNRTRPALVLQHGQQLAGGVGVGVGGSARWRSAGPRGRRGAARARRCRVADDDAEAPNTSSCTRVERGRVADGAGAGACAAPALAPCGDARDALGARRRSVPACRPSAMPVVSIACPARSPTASPAAATNVAVCAGRHEHQAGVGAELAGAEGQRADERRGERVRRRRRRARRAARRPG